MLSGPLLEQKYQVPMRKLLCNRNNFNILEEFFESRLCLLICVQLLRHFYFRFQAPLQHTMACKDYRAQKLKPLQYKGLWSHKVTQNTMQEPAVISYTTLFFFFLRHITSVFFNICNLYLRVCIYTYMYFKSLRFK